MSEQAENVVRADAVVAKRLDLVDRNEKTRLTFGSTPNGEAVAGNFLDANGDARIIFAVQEDGNATISMLDHGQKERIRISSGALGNAITLYDSDQKTRLLLQLDPETDGAEIHFVDENGQPQIVISQEGRDRDNPSPDIFVR